MYRRVLKKSCVFAAVSCAALVMILPVAGCGGGSSARGKKAGMDVSDVERIRAVASSLDAGPGAWESAFAEGAAPAGAQRELYLNRSFLVGEVKIDGDSATAEITVKDANQKEIGRTRWTLEKGADTAWKITAAPLPDGA